MALRLQDAPIGRAAPDPRGVPAMFSDLATFIVFKYPYASQMSERGFSVPRRSCPPALMRHSRLPTVAAPMLRVSGPAMDIASAGQGVGAVRGAGAAATIVDRLVFEYDAAAAKPRLAAAEGVPA